jgi:hypothetical protein
MDLPERSPAATEFCCIALDGLWAEAAPAAIADRESPHDANALALSPTTRNINAASLTKFSVWIDFIMLFFVKFIMLLLVKVDEPSGRDASLVRAALRLEPPNKLLTRNMPQLPKQAYRVENFVISGN